MIEYLLIILAGLAVLAGVIALIGFCFFAPKFYRKWKEFDKNWSEPNPPKHRIKL